MTTAGFIVALASFIVVALGRRGIFGYNSPLDDAMFGLGIVLIVTAAGLLLAGAIV